MGRRTHKKEGRMAVKNLISELWGDIKFFWALCGFWGNPYKGGVSRGRKK
ncbi:MAG: hypothetical protein PHT51_01805 [Patescibacteria group bacterium]|nr:hypothetical protein [Patescibacteria group bacterium]MDD4610368.1 hypothetical protein [Patescibacteria group bacterium]